MLIESKEVTYHAVLEESPKCKLPKHDFKQDILYQHPKSSVPAYLSSPWYEEAAVGKNGLSVMVKEN